MKKFLQSRLFRYFLTAGTAAIVDVGGFAALCYMRFPVGPAAVTSFGLATVVNYLLSGRWVFDRAPSLRGFGLFLSAAVGGSLVNVSVTLVCTLYLGIAPVLAKLTGVGTAFLLNFWLNQKIVFRRSELQRNQ